MKKFFRVCAIFFLICLILSGCVEKKEAETKVSSKENYLVYDIGEIPEDLYSINTKNTKNDEVLSMLFSGLVSEDYNTMEIKPALADTWTLSPDKLQYTFHIREGAKWSSGEDITSYDVYDFFKQILSSSNGKFYAYDLKSIYGIDNYISGKTPFEGVAISVENDNVLKIRLNSPCSYFLKKLTQPIYYIRKMDNNLKNWSKNYNEIKYSGPYKISGISNNTALLEENSNFFSKETNSMKKFKLKYHYNEKEVSAYTTADFENAKNIDVFSNPTLSEVPRLKAKGQIDMFKTWDTIAFYFNMNNSSIASDINFRKAMTYLIDRNKILNSISNDFAVSENTFVPAELFNAGKCEDIFRDYDMNLAFQSLDKSGYSFGKKVTLIYKENTLNRELCENFVYEVNKTLQEQNRSKIDFDVKAYSGKVLDNVISKGKYDIYLGDYNIWYNSAVSFFDMWDSRSPLNVNYKNNVYDDYIYSLHNVDSDSDNILKEMEEQLANDLPVVPVALKKDIVCRRNSLTGLKENRYGELMINFLR
ncbi:ABC transporter substrate-binding protein [Clostridium felsineum]|uniref:ABC transporter substrate-binding protein n=1 Tax=Clostridium felsineum TaxID=36839 RepID=UPI00098CBA46|nr:ABC transporter substrate-binding protein [Clostridium felsineum]URZ04082.1 Oligopeptide-binding protein OppA [Clostridium felsineum]